MIEGDKFFGFGGCRKSRPPEEWQVGQMNWAKFLCFDEFARGSLCAEIQCPQDCTLKDCIFKIPGLRGQEFRIGKRRIESENTEI